MSLRARLPWLALSLALGAVGCGAEPQPVEGRVVRVGEASGAHAVVAGVAKDRSFTLYSCGVDSDFATRTHWFSGALDAFGAFSVDAPDGWNARGTWTAEGADAVFTPDEGAEFTWSGAEAKASEAGLYGGEDAGCRTGVVVGAGTGEGADGAADVNGTWCDDAGDYAQVTPILPVDARGFRVGASTPLGPRQLLVEPVDPP